MTKHRQMIMGYQGAKEMYRRGFKRLANRVWQKHYPQSQCTFRVIVAEDFLTMQITVVDEMPQT